MVEKISDFDFIIRLIVSLLLGSIIGLERQLKNKHAGIRTCAILCMTSSFIMMSGLYAASLFNNTEMILQQLMAVIISVGFIGSGVIYKVKDDKGTTIIHGLTTTAILLVTAIIGMMIGLGLIIKALIVFIIAFLSLIFFRMLEIKFGLKKDVRTKI